jgi:5-methylcytosine-specific restriction endonuclease McrA
MAERTCTKCGIEQPVDLSHFPLTRRGHLSGVCRACGSEKQRIWRAAHRETCNAYHRAYRAAHPEVEANRDPVQVAARKRAYQAAHPEKNRACKRAYRAVHADEMRAWGRNRRARQRNAPGSHTAADVVAQYLRQHGCCYWCAAKVGKGYHVDHVIPLAKGGSNGSDNLVIACPSCNRKKSDKLPQEFALRLC